MAIGPYYDNPNITTDDHIDYLIPEVISKEVELKSVEEGFRRFREFVVYKEDLRKEPGSVLDIPKVANLRRAQDLGESSMLRGTGSKLSVTRVQLTPAEVGDEVQYGEYSQLTTIIDLQDLIVELLSRQATKRENLDVRDAAFAGTNIRYAGGVAYENSVTAQLGSADIDYVVEELETNETEKYAGDTFVGFIHPYAKTALKNNLVSTSDYAHSVPHLYAGEIGMYNRTRFIETAYCPLTAWVQGSDVVDDGNTPAWTKTNWNTLVNENDTYCKTETWTVTYTHTTSRYTIYGTQTGSAYNWPSGATAAPGLLYFTAAQLAGSTIYITTSATAGTDAAPIRFDTAAFAANAGATETIGFETQRQCGSLILGQRHLAFGVIKPVTMLGVEKWDYGRVIGIAWNAFWQAVILNQDYGYVVRTKR